MKNEYGKKGGKKGRRQELQGKGDIEDRRKSLMGTEESTESE